MLRKFLACLLLLGLGLNFEASPAKKAKKAAYKKTFLISNQTKKSLRRFFRENKEVSILIAAEIAIISVFAGLIYFSGKDRFYPVKKPCSGVQATPSQPDKPTNAPKYVKKNVRFDESVRGANLGNNPDQNKTADYSLNKWWNALTWVSQTKQKDPSSFYTAPFATTQGSNFYCGIYSAAAALAGQKKIFAEASGVRFASNYNFQELCDGNYKSLLKAFEDYKIVAHKKLRNEFEARVKGLGRPHDHYIEKWQVDQTKVDDVVRLYQKADKENKVLELCLNSSLVPENIRRAAQQTYLPCAWGSSVMPHEKDLADFLKIHKIEMSCLSERLFNIIVEEANSGASLDEILKMFITIEAHSSFDTGQYKIVPKQKVLTVGTDEQKVVNLSNQGIEATTIDGLLDAGTSALIKKDLQRLLKTGIGIFILRIAGIDHFVCLDIDKDRPKVGGVDMRVIYRDSMNTQTSLPVYQECQTLRAHLITFLDAKFPRSGS